jgi:hypothetical protein
VPHRAFRVAVAAAAFLAGLAAVWLSGLGARVETALADRLSPSADVSVVSVPAPPLVGREEDDTQAVYETLLREMFGGNIPGRLLVLDPEAGGHVLSDGDRERIAWAADEVLDDYVRKNGVRKGLPPLPHLAAGKVRLDPEEYRRIFADEKTDGWKTFDRLYPNSAGYLSLSAVGFNRTGDRALVYYSQFCGWTCAEGAYVLLRKGAGGWEVERKQVMWVS